MLDWLKKCSKQYVELPAVKVFPFPPIMIIKKNANESRFFVRDESTCLAQNGPPIINTNFSKTLNWMENATNITIQWKGDKELLEW